MVFKLDNHIAEVFIAPAIVKRNSLIFKEEFKKELSRCVIHGILHIIGFDDDNIRNKNRMWKRQESFLKKYLNWNK